MNRTRGYLRYSDHKQDDGYSIEYQTTEIEQYAKRHNFNLLKLHVDQAQTGTKVAGREEFFALFDAVKAGEVDIVLKVAAEFSAFKQTNRPPFVSLSAEIKRE